MKKQKITTFLWYDNQAEEAMNFYVSVFSSAPAGKEAKIGSVARYPEGSPGPVGSVMTATFTIDGQEFIVLNGGPQFKFTEAISLLVDCNSQEEVDWFWEKLSEGGEKSMCGWLKDKFGLWWQIVPSALSEMMSDQDKDKAQRVMMAMLKMKKIDIAILKQAYDGK